MEKEQSASRATTSNVANNGREASEPVTLTDSPVRSVEGSAWKAASQSFYRLLPDGTVDETSLPGDLLKFVADKCRRAIEDNQIVIETEVQKRVALARQDIEIQTRQVVEAELRAEVNASKERELDAIQQCAATEVKLKEQVKEYEDAKAKLDAERLEMLEAKRSFEAERNALVQERDKATKQQQSTILNKGGAKRAPIKLSLGFGQPR